MNSLLYKDEPHTCEGDDKCFQNIMNFLNIDLFYCLKKWLQFNARIFVEFNLYEF